MKKREINFYCTLNDEKKEEMKKKTRKNVDLNRLHNQRMIQIEKNLKKN